MMAENRISELVLKAAFNVHFKLGPGLIAETYRPCLAYEIKSLGLTVETHKQMPLIYGDLKVNVGYSVDLMVENRVLIIVKSCHRFSDLDMAKMQTYLKLSGCKMGFLINFNVATLKSGIRRVLFRHDFEKNHVKTAS